MANEQNLKPISSVSEAREKGSKGGKKSAEAKRNKKMLKDCLEILLERKTDVDGKKLTGAEAIALTAFQRALGGDMKAMEFVRDTAGQKPIEKVMVADIDQSVIDEVEAMVYADDTEE